MPQKPPSRKKSATSKSRPGSKGRATTKALASKAVQVTTRGAQPGLHGLSSQFARPRTWATEKGFVACEVGKIIYALPIADVQEILVPGFLTLIPQAPAAIVGALDHRGEVVPVFDLGARLGFGETSSPRRKWVLVRVQGRTLGVVVHQVHEVFRVMESDVRLAPKLGGPEAQSSKEVVAYREGLAYVLDVEKLAQLADLPHLEEEAP